MIAASRRRRSTAWSLKWPGPRVSRSWLCELPTRHRELCIAALVPRSRRPKSSPSGVPAAKVDEVVAPRRPLAEEGLDAGASTIQQDLQLRHRHRRAVVPSASSILLRD